MVLAGRLIIIIMVLAGRLNLGVPYVAADLPAGASRWLQDAVGYDMTIVRGVPTFEHGNRTGALPAGLVRGPLRGNIAVRTLETIDVSPVTCLFVQTSFFTELCSASNLLCGLMPAIPWFQC